MPTTPPRPGLGRQAFLLVPRPWFPSPACPTQCWGWGGRAGRSDTKAHEELAGKAQWRLHLEFQFRAGLLSGGASAPRRTNERSCPSPPWKPCQEVKSAEAEENQAPQPCLSLDGCKWRGAEGGAPWGGETKKEVPEVSRREGWGGQGGLWATGRSSQLPEQEALGTQAPSCPLAAARPRLHHAPLPVEMRPRGCVLPLPELPPPGQRGRAPGAWRVAGKCLPLRLGHSPTLQPGGKF